MIAFSFCSFNTYYVKEQFNNLIPNSKVEGENEENHKQRRLPSSNFSSVPYYIGIFQTEYGVTRPGQYDSTLSNLCPH